MDEYLERIMDVTTGGDYELARTRSALGDLLDLPSDVEKAENLDPKARFENLVLAIENLVGAIERTGPVVVSVADGQWLDGGTADVLRRLSSDLNEKRVAVLIETRTPDIPLTFTHRIDVGPLQKSDIARLVERILGESPPLNMVSTVVERSGGNPFFAVQLATYLRREANDADDLLRSFNSEADVPIDMRKVLVARLDDLPGGVRRLVQNASVLGRDIDLEILRQIHSGEGDFESNVRGAVAAGIWNRVDDTHVTFSDLLVREAASGMLLHSDTRALHDAAASAIGRAAGHKGRRHAELAYHHDRAGNDAIAAEHYLAAGRTAADRYDNHEAVVHLDRALHLLSPDDSASRYRALLLKHNVYELEGNRPLQEEMIVSMEALESVDGGQTPIEILLLRGRLLAALGRYSEAVDLLDRSSEMVARSTVVEQASLTFLQAQLARYEGRIEDARSLADTARELFTAAGDELRLAATDDFAGGLAWESGDFQAAADLHRSAADTFSAAGRVSEETRALNNLGTAIFSIGDYSEARKIHQAGADRSRAVGYRMGEGDHLDNIGGTAWAVGDLDGAMKFYTDALKIREGMDDAWGIAISKGNLGATLRAMGIPEEGLTLYREALEIDQQIGRRRGEAYDFHGIGLCHLDLGRYNLATESLRRSAEIRDELGEDHLANESHIACAVATLRRGDTETAIELVKSVLSDEGDDFFNGAVETTLTRLRCIEVLEASSSAPVEALRQRVKEDVLDRASRISDPDDRRSYLEQVESHSQALADT